MTPNMRNMKPFSDDGTASNLISICEDDQYNRVTRNHPTDLNQMIKNQSTDSLYGSSYVNVLTQRTTDR